MDYLLLFGGLIGLWLATELTVRQATRLAEGLGLSSMFIGLTIIALGTDLPELVIAINGAINNLSGGTDSSGIIAGNTIGSSIAQTSLVLGISALIQAVVRETHTNNLIKQLLFAGLLLLLLTLDGGLSRIDGGVLILAFSAYIWFSYRQMAKAPAAEAPPRNGQSKILTAGLLLLGLAGIIGSSELAVDRALAIAESMGVKQSFVGAILMGLGTSLPELAITLSALLRQGNPDLSIGNILGSSIFDLLVPLGVAALIAPLNFAADIRYFDLPVMLGLALLMYILLHLRKGIQTGEGILLIVFFVAYAVGKYFLSV